MHGPDSGRRPRRGTLRRWVAVGVLIGGAGGPLGGCSRSAAPAAAEAAPGKRRQDMADFMKNQKQAGGQARKSSGHP